MYFFFLSLYEENSKSLGLACMFSDETLFSSLVLVTLEWDILCRCDTLRGIDLSSGLSGTIFLCSGICLLAASGPVVEAHCQFSSNTGTLPLFFSGFDFPLHLFVSINAKYWKVRIDFLSKNMRGLFFKLQYFLRKSLWLICVRIKETPNSPFWMSVTQSNLFTYLGSSQQKMLTIVIITIMQYVQLYNQYNCQMEIIQ